MTNSDYADLVRKLARRLDMAVIDIEANGDATQAEIVFDRMGILLPEMRDCLKARA